MLHTTAIHPEFEKLKGISLFGGNKNEKIEYEEIEKLIQQTPINDKIDNICYILFLLKKEKHNIDIKNSSKDHKNIFNNDRLEVSKFLKLLEYENDKRLIINRVRFDIGKVTRYNPDKKKYEYLKESSFCIQSTEVIQEILKIVLSKYKPSNLKGEKERFKKQTFINKPSQLRKDLAYRLFTYLTKCTNLGENKKYYVIGFLFQLSELETKLSENDYSEIINNSYSIPYKSYPDFVTTNIRNKYFKKG